MSVGRSAGLGSEGWAVRGGLWVQGQSGVVVRRCWVGGGCWSERSICRPLGKPQVPVLSSRRNLLHLWC